MYSDWHAVRGFKFAGQDILDIFTFFLSIIHILSC